MDSCVKQENLQGTLSHDAIPLTELLDEEVSKMSMTEMDLRLYPFMQVSKLKRMDFESIMTNILLETRTQKSKWVMLAF